mmetsp:Transcript_71359/g.83012  ORF Transcript_71359/g.83012 Transcript_71359/m.83012 type:complete len:947 (+) Transcript_71359:71-2911(+)
MSTSTELEVPELWHSVPAMSLEDAFQALSLDRESVVKGFSVEVNAQVVSWYQGVVQQWVIAQNAASRTAALHQCIDFALRVFHCENVTGELSDAEAEMLCDALSRFHFGDEVENRFVQRLLMVDGEMPAVSVKYAALLLAVLAIVRCKDSSLLHDVVPFEDVWRMRAVFRHQLCLQRRSHSLFHELASCIEAHERNEDLSPELLLELGHVQNYFHRRDLAAQKFLKAMQVSGLSIEESAIRGVRTRWQQHLVVQAVLNASSARPASPIDSRLDQPAEIGGEKSGHDLFDRPQLAPAGEDGTPAAPVAEGEESSSAPPMTALKPLAAVDKAIILALAEQIHFDNMYHGLTKHHMQVYLERLIVDPAISPFIIRSQMLLARARLEHGRSRVAERAFLQVQELVDQHNAKRNPNLATWHRSNPQYFYLVAYPTIWKLKRELATQCMEENLNKTALDLFEQIQDWEKIMECCKALDKRKKAENLALELLEKDPANPMLWVALGEATREDAHLWKAWELCGHKMAAPMRSLAKLAMEREHYEKVVQYFNESVRINPIFGGDWFTLGFASMRLKDYVRSGEAFTRACQIDPNDAFAWNNLASIMLQQGRMRPAFNAMSQALRNNRRSWRMWQNYFSIGVELLEVTEATHALATALEIAQREMKLEAESMKRFVSIAIRYMKGEIRGTDNQMEAERGAEGESTPEVPHSSLAQNEENLSSEVMSGGRSVDEVEAELTDLRPLADDVEMPATFFPAKVAAQDKEREEIRVAIAARYSQRLRSIFQTILGLFVTDADVYHCAAELHRFLDGPLSAFELRQKELRCAEQMDQWDRTESKFQRVLECMQRMAQDVEAALEGTFTPPFSPEHAVPTPATVQPAPETTESAPTDASIAETAAITTTMAPEIACKALLSHLDGALHQSAEHLEESKVYRETMILRKRVAQLVAKQSTVKK